MKLENDYKLKVVAALKEARKLYGGSDAAFAKQWDINSSVWSRVKNGEIDKVISEDQWITMGQDLEVSNAGFEFIKAETEVYEAISNDIKFCKEQGQAMIMVDDCGIGKTFTGKNCSKTLENCFYIDLSQCGQKDAFVRTLAKVIGVKYTDRLIKVVQRIKYALSVLNKPMVIIDEGGFVNKAIVQFLQELWNATANGICGWYMMGAEGFRKVIERGIKNDVPGYREFFNRYGNKFMKVTPDGKADRVLFYEKLVKDVLSMNMKDMRLMNRIIKKCLSTDEVNDDEGNKIGGLRQAKTLLILNAA
ncbi:AAA family ATPase [Mucilaginibacter sp.]|uniref:AAA family ATPase n=1 Tax=Mucilaginibacter sp. TaxID=1882438 RepID=UPI0032654EBD